ncbi:hypothetical protein [Mycobacterium sp. SMC-4]|uniref:hypothetical protein n=1 Tax=Mycobacterium sp. SMC-4 TaxID=2857059 RepID=UPI0021B1F5D0|nr:hypothetical protein [Mycobacterium sp. SMC-4]UXA19527.1 hypothetical protein KXD98_07985 [Mycobacterium sp. SMC-4]
MNARVTVGRVGTGDGRDGRYVEVAVLVPSGNVYVSTSHNTGHFTTDALAAEKLRAVMAAAVAAAPAIVAAYETCDRDQTRAAETRARLVRNAIETAVRKKK